jgi:hypothetical protein
MAMAMATSMWLDSRYMIFLVEQEIRRTQSVH